MGYAQRVISGVVFDQNELPVSNVKIQERETANFTFTSFDGTFTLQRFDSENMLIFSHPQFDTLRKVDTIAEHVKIFLTLKRSSNPYNLGGFVGYTDFEHKVVNKHLENMPYFLGEADVNRQLQMLPGIEHGRERGI